MYADGARRGPRCTAGARKRPEAVKPHGRVARNAWVGSTRVTRYRDRHLPRRRSPVGLGVRRKLNPRWRVRSPSGARKSHRAVPSEGRPPTQGCIISFIYLRGDVRLFNYSWPNVRFGVSCSGTTPERSCQAPLGFCKGKLARPSKGRPGNPSRSTPLGGKLMRFDFSEFHPLDHRPGTSRCRGLPGGVRQHLKVAWWLGRRDQIIRPFRRALCCPFGRHRWNVWHGAGFPDGKRRINVVCADCPARRLPSEHDIDNPPSILRALENGGKEGDEGVDGAHAPDT